MIKQDYIERLVQQISNLIAKLLLNKDPKESFAIIDENYEGWLGLSRQDLNNLREEELLDTLIEEQKLNLNHLEFLAYLLGEEGKIHFQNKDAEAASIVIRKALLIFDHVEDSQGIYDMERRNYIDFLKEIMS